MEIHAVTDSIFDRVNTIFQQIKKKEYLREYRRKNKPITAVLTKKEFKLLEKQAKEAGFKHTPYFKKIAFAYLNNEIVIPVTVEKRLTELNQLVRSCANNLNQIAAKTNSLKKATVFDLMKAKKQIHTLERTIESFFSIYYPHDHQEHVPQESVRHTEVDSLC